MREFTNPVSNIAIFLDSERHFLEALTRWNYFPNQKDSSTELPPCFSTSRFTPEVAAELSEIVLTGDRKDFQFDLAEYKATRFNNVPRILGLIHPLAYSKIFTTLKTYRGEILELMDDENSAITAEQHNDGRMFIMNYEDHETKTKDMLDLSFGAEFRAHADVANCFGSIYTHSLEWAIQGYDEAKRQFQKKNGPKHWSSALDTVLRNAKRKETTGLPIGPCTSSIAVEIILAAVDKELAGKFRFVRYIDDYTAYCWTHLEAQEFIRALSIALYKYRLTLNLSKTRITELPEPLVDPWITELNNAIPWRAEPNGTSSLCTRDAINFLDFAVQLKRAEPDGSVLKLAAGLICSRAQGDTAAIVFQYVLSLSWHYPILLPLLEKIDATSDLYDKDAVVQKFNGILEVNALHRRSDGMCWALYYLKQLSAQPTPENVTRVVQTLDATAIALLSSFEAGEEAAVAYANQVIEGGGLYELDRCWILLYQLFFHGKIANPYADESTFVILKKYDVQFLNSPKKSSKAEDYCSYYSNPFRKTGENPVSFKAYLEGDL
ncbi:antiviral reverse transcriptase Drt4 [Pseudomonas sp. NFACC04-2]|uniref:antiviral reverse transcriptase Drt4 n=1 Tax=Pseudomonas sp. NFACC04-2 TaxID=1566242 RepID=UPI0009091111|nr:antiviral reverse transcriptase Drt4 [Pseudomonas sp. NFACC04-2]SFW55281.1 Reverse transcriptase (RNA-dependent DNA polymerase) [Pseudomonas sp. NFACC04-2]